MQGVPSRVALARPIFRDQWQNDVATAAANTAYGLLHEEVTLQKAVELAHAAMAGTSKIAEGVLQLSKGQSVACHAGCAHCCYQAVGVVAPEALAIYEHLQRTLSPEKFEIVAERVRQADDRTRELSAAQRLSPDLPCPFLEEQQCTIYEVRPLACRGKNSLDAVACERTLRDPEARAQFLAGKLPVPSFLEPIRAFHAVSAGVQLALHELLQLNAEPLELTAALRILIDAPAQVTTQWLDGQNSFHAARGGDISDNPLIHELNGTIPDKG